MHDCSTCEAGKANRCPLQGIAPWLNDGHEEEAHEAIDKAVDELAIACTELSTALGFNLMQVMLTYKDVCNFMMSCFTIGYHSGRTFVELPKCVENM